MSEQIGITLKEIAEKRKLPIKLLKEEFKILDCSRNGIKALRIPYLDEDGQESAVRFRTGPTGHDSKWRTGDKTTLYGLHKMERIQEKGYVIIVEGETDTWTGWHYDIAIIGVPGKSIWKDSWHEKLEGLKVYVWQEPDAEDFIERIAKHIPELKVIKAPSEVKDICEAHMRGFNVKEMLTNLVGKAIPYGEIAAARQQENIEQSKEAVKDILEAKDSIGLIMRAIREQGFGGSTRIPLLVFIATVSRLLKMRVGAMPVHLLLLGPASAGKNYILKLVLNLLPAEAYHMIDAGSPRVLIYDTEPLKHRVVVFGEADSLPAGEDNPAASAIRNLLQDNRLHYRVVDNYEVKVIDKEGPTCVITTSTKKLGHQLNTRLFIVDVPDDVRQIRKALKAQAQIETSKCKKPNQQLIDYQAYLQACAPWEVVVPFADRLAELIGRSVLATRINRDFARLISLIKSVAIIRHTKRDKDEDGRLVATIDDYKVVYALVKDIYGTSITGANENVRKVVKTVSDLKAAGVKKVTQAAVRKKLDFTKMQALRAVRTAINNEWLVNQEPGKGRPADLIVGELLPEEIGLPKPSEVTGVTPAVTQIQPSDQQGNRVTGNKSERVQEVSTEQQSLSAVHRVNHVTTLPHSSEGHSTGNGNIQIYTCEQCGRLTEDIVRSALTVLCFECAGIAAPEGSPF